MSCRLFTLGLAAVFLAGCSGKEEKPPEYQVKGKVSYAGKPVVEGAIVLDPADGMGAPAQGSIVDGGFDMKSQPGKKIVRISANKKTGEKDQYGEEVIVPLIPDKHNGMSKLEKDIQPNDENYLDIELAK